MWERGRVRFNHQDGVDQHTAAPRGGTGRNIAKKAAWRVSKKRETCTYDTGSFSLPTARDANVTPLRVRGLLFVTRNKITGGSPHVYLFGGKPSARGAALIKKGETVCHNQSEKYELPKTINGPEHSRAAPLRGTRIVAITATIEMNRITRRSTDPKQIARDKPRTADQRYRGGPMMSEEFVGPNCRRQLGRGSCCRRLPE
jgi:hypothetical protein